MAPEGAGHHHDCLCYTTTAWPDIRPRVDERIAMDQNYHETLIAAADDSPAEHSTVPRGRGARKTVAEVQSKPQPCLRPSPLPKKYGWGFIFGAEADDKLALTPVGRTSTGRRWREGSSSSSRRCARAARRKMQRARRERAGVAAR